jgi:tetratricopeptide (TPR) repeat protein
MTLRHPKPLLLCAVAVLGISGCAGVKVAHVPPGSSLREATAQRAELVKLPPTPAPAVTAHAGGNQSAPETDKADRVADAYSRGEFCAKAGKDDEAIAAFTEAVKIDPTFVDAWTYLAAMYEKKGNEKEALNAFKHAKLATTTKGSG